MNQDTGTVNPGASSAYSRTLGNGLLVLELLRSHPHGLGVNAIAAELGVHRTVVYRLLGTLRTHHLVDTGADGRHRMGLGVLELASTVRVDLRQAAEPHLAAVAERVSATAFLTLADGDEAVSACVVEPKNARMHVSYRAGLRHPLTVSAAGIAILAGRQASPGERPEIGEARSAGYAASTGELQAGAWGLATALPDATGHAEASVGVVALEALDADEVLAAVRDAVRAIARMLAP